ncbi:cell surface glycoprotein MUC18-like isoform X3 [Anabas testudineus]|uniref:cell surface glycoprotein MUC18-like isoform X3 n=1 Tax=Anabas testudineus TaxID=64144 RepID=UPI000E45AA72|nr:cell surface glycoprotein MUC18-like isoform X3 [Anabas testudineus]
MAFLNRAAKPLFLLFSLVSCSAWAKVELTMQESVELYVDDSAQIPCQYHFINISSEARIVRIQWFVVIGWTGDGLALGSGVGKTHLKVFAWAKVELTIQESVEVYVDDSAQIPCQYHFINASSEARIVGIQWFVSEGDNSQRRIFYSHGKNHLVESHTDYSGRMEVDVDNYRTQLIIHSVQLSDDREFFCQVIEWTGDGLAVGSGEGKTHLKVFVRPEAPVISGVLTVISVTSDLPSKVASCEVQNGFPIPNITWYKNSMRLMPSPGYVNVLTLVTQEYSGLYSVQSTLEYKVVKVDKDAHFSCEVNFFVPGGVRTMESNSINITIHYPTTVVELWKKSPQGLVKEGDTVELRCQGDGNPPLPVIFNKKQDQDVVLESSGDMLILSPVSRKDSGIYQCRPLGTSGYTNIKGEMQLTVHYLDPAVVMPKDSDVIQEIVMLNGESLTVACNAPSSSKTDTVWYKDGEQVGKGNILHLQDTTFETAGEYICEVTVLSHPSLHTSASVYIVVQGSPQLMGVDEDVQLEKATGRMVNLSCVAQGYPLPSISWNIIGSQDWHEVVSKSNLTVAQSVLTVEVTSDISAFCNVSNYIGTEVKAFSIKAIPTVTTTAPFSPGEIAAQYEATEGSGVIMVVIILCLLLLAIFGSVLHFLHKKGKFPCGRSDEALLSSELALKPAISVRVGAEEAAVTDLLADTTS